MNPLIVAILVTLLPLTELRVGLPLALTYAAKNGISVFPIFLLILFLNISLIFIIFFFLDNIHNFLLEYSYYNKIFTFYLKKIQRRIQKFEKRHKSWGFVALFLLVAIPLPFTGAYSGVFLSWILNLERSKSIWAISLGITVAGIIIYLGTLGFFAFF